MLSWVVRRTRLPLLTLPCVDCPSGHATVGDGRFRVTDNGKLLAVRLVISCVGCGRPGKLAVHERVPIRSLPAGRLAGYSAGVPALVADTLFDPLFARRHRFALDWEGCWELRAPAVPGDSWPLRVTVTFEDPVPVRPEQLIAQALGMSRGEIAHRVRSDAPLNRRTRSGFSFVLTEPVP
ncbi:DUF1062 domain-containing protein [Nonomuraea gerenzanensis]|nr:DUF1062 domain-containing protein [Nonomuraea gerenzanensis]